MSTNLAVFVTMASILVFLVPSEFALALLAGIFFFLVFLSVVLFLCRAWFTAFTELDDWLNK